MNASKHSTTCKPRLHTNSSLSSQIQHQILSLGNKYFKETFRWNVFKKPFTVYGICVLPDQQYFATFITSSVVRDKSAWKAWGCESCLISLSLFFFACLCLGPTWPYWSCLVLSGPVWSCLVLSGPYQALLGISHLLTYKTDKHYDCILHKKIRIQK